jgi:hypothetical protein
MADLRSGNTRKARGGNDEVSLSAITILAWAKNLLEGF